MLPPRGPFAGPRPADSFACSGLATRCREAKLGPQLDGIISAISIPARCNSHPVRGGIAPSFWDALLMLLLIRTARAEDAGRIGAIARAAYVKYVPRIGREPAPMVADFAAEVASGHVVVIGTAGALDGYLIGWPETDAYFIDNIAVDPAQQGKV